jgi:2,4-dienoyl-CoA reductase-like NADH-dependent reductase (Old Yellow Enzyme family)
VRTAHATGLAMNAGGDLAAYHSAAARSGVGLTIIEAASTHPTTTARIRFDDDSQLSVYSGMLRALRKYPMKVSSSWCMPVARS